MNGGKTRLFLLHSSDDWLEKLSRKWPKKNFIYEWFMRVKSISVIVENYGRLLTGRIDVIVADLIRDGQAELDWRYRVVNDGWLAGCRRWGIVVAVNDDWLAVCRRRSIVAGRHQCSGTVHLLRLTSHAVAIWCHSQVLTNSSLFMLSNNCWMVCHQHSHIKISV